MNSRSSSLFCLALALLAMSSAIEAFDITQMLGKFPELGLFNQYLSETKLADQINSRKTITILALDNSSVSAIAGKPKDTIKAILSTHVILDYFDEQKLMSTVGQNTQLTTLYQTTGPANNLQGFIKVGVVGEGEIAFGSAVNGAPLNAELVQTLTTQPYDISILQVSQPIVAPGIDAQSSPSAAAASSSPPPSSSKATSSPPPSSSSASSSPPPSKAAAPPKAEAPVASRKQISRPTASPVEAETPLLAPEGAPVSAPSEAPVPASSSSSRIQTGFVWALVMGLGALLVAM